MKWGGVGWGAPCIMANCIHLSTQPVLPTPTTPCSACSHPCPLHLTCHPFRPSGLVGCAHHVHCFPPAPSWHALEAGGVERFNAAYSTRWLVRASTSVQDELRRGVEQSSERQTVGTSPGQQLRERAQVSGAGKLQGEAGSLETFWAHGHGCLRQQAQTQEQTHALQCQNGNLRRYAHRRCRTAQAGDPQAPGCTRTGGSEES